MMARFLFELGRLLSACTTSDDHLALVRVAAVRPVTGNSVYGWQS